MFSLETTPPINVIARLKRFWSKRSTAGTDKKSVSSIERRESGVEAVGVNFSCHFVFCLSIDVHLVYILMYIFSISE